MVEVREDEDEDEDEDEGMVAALGRRKRRRVCIGRAHCNDFELLVS